MADDPTDVKPRLHAAANNHNSHRLTASSSLSAPLKLDEGYSDESRSPLDRVANDVMSLPDWLLAQSETDRAELAYSLLRTLRTSSLAAIVDRVTPLLHMDPVLKLPPEITFEIFAYLDPQTLLTASLASRAWRDRICDPRLWRDLYTTEGWRIDIDAVRAYEDEHSRLSSPQSRKSRSRYADSDLGEPKHKKRVPPTWLDSRVTDLLDDKAGVLAEADPEGDHVMSDASADRLLPAASAPGPELEDSRISSPETSRTTPNGRASSSRRPSSKESSPLLLRMPNGAAKINWLYLYRQRRRLEENWAKGRFTNFQLPHPAHMDECHQDFVYTIQFSAKWLVSGSRDKTIRVWDLTTQRLWYAPLVGHTKSVLCLQFDADPTEDIIISGGSDMSIIVWRFSTGEKLHQIARAHDDSVLNLQYDKRYLVTGSKDKLIKVWNRNTLIPTDKDYPQMHHSPGVSYPAYIINTTDVPSPVLEDNLARSQIQPLAPYSLIMTLAGHGTAVNAIQMGETEIVSASGDRMIKVWNLRNGTCLKTLGGHKKGIACVQFDGRRIISGGNDNSVRIFDHASGAEVACLQGHENLVRTVQAGFGDPPGAEEAMRLEALAVETSFFDAQRAGADVDLGPRAMRRAGHRQDTTGSRNPRDINALGARIPPGGGGSRWARIVSGSYDENVIVWKKDKRHRWTASQKLSYKAAVDNAQVMASGSSSSSSSRRSSRDNSRSREARTRPDDATQTHRPGPSERGRDREREREHQVDDGHRRHRHQPHPHTHPPRVFKLQFDARKIICGSTDPIIVGWDFAGLDPDLREASQFFTSL